MQALFSLHSHIQAKSFVYVGTEIQTYKQKTILVNQACAWSGRLSPLGGRHAHIRFNQYPQSI